MTSMQAVRIHDYGGLDTLVYEEAPRPTPATGQVLIQVHAAGVNPIDWKIREGWLKEIFHYNFPLILGTDVAGIVEAVGDGVTHLQPGQPIFGVVDMTLSGAYAEYALGLADAIAPKPHTLNFVQSASIPIVALTAWQGLFEVGNLNAGQSVLIHAAAGGVGSFAVQFAKHHGLKVFGTASAQNLDYIRDLGVDQAIDYHTTSFEQVVHEVDMVFDTIGGEVQTQSLNVLKPGGILVSTAAPPNESQAQQQGVRAVMMTVQPKATQLIEIANLIDQGLIQLPAQQIFPLQAVRQAHQLSQSGHTRGKLVLQVRS